MTVVERYLELALRIGKHDDELIEAYHGPPELATRIAAEEPCDPQRLREDAESLLWTSRRPSSSLRAAAGWRRRCARCTRWRGA